MVILILSPVGDWFKDSSCGSRGSCFSMELTVTRNCLLRRMLSLFPFFFLTWALQSELFGRIRLLVVVCLVVATLYGLVPLRPDIVYIMFGRPCLGRA